MGNNPICTLLSKLLLKSHCGIMAENEENREATEEGPRKRSSWVKASSPPKPLSGTHLCKANVDRWLVNRRYFCPSTRKTEAENRSSRSARTPQWAPVSKQQQAADAAQGLRAHTAHGEDRRSWGPSTHAEWLTTDYNSSLGDPTPSSGLWKKSLKKKKRQ